MWSFINQFYSYLGFNFCAVCCLKITHLSHTKPSSICSKCDPLLPWTQRSCYRCGLNLSTHNNHTNTPLLCGSCLSQPPDFDSLSSIFSYQYPLTHLIVNLKFHKQLHLAHSLGCLLAQKIQPRTQPLPQALIPVPLHYQRQRQRGFNQALEIARPLSKVLKIPLLHQICTRNKNTLAQSMLNAKQRQDNMLHSFSAVPLNSLQHIAIIDDVVSTSATVNQLSRVLRAQGATFIEVWCICRTNRK